MSTETLSCLQAEAEYGVPRKRIAQLVKAGELGSVTVGKRLRVRGEDLDRVFGARTKRTCPLPGCDEPAGTGPTGGCSGRHATAILERRQARADGEIALPELARSFRVDKDLITRLYELKEIEGRLDTDGRLWLSRTSAARYAWSRPRCVIDGCETRVMGRFQACRRHRGELVELTCEWCECRFQRHPWEGRPRSCSHEHRALWFNHGDDNETRRAARLDGMAQRHADLAELKASSGLLSLLDVVEALPREFRRSHGVVAAHARDGYLEPVPNDFGEFLVTADEFAAYVRWLANNRDWRRQRFNATTLDHVEFRGNWYEARFESTAEHGRLAAIKTVIVGKRKNGAPRGLDADGIQRVRQLYEKQGMSQNAIGLTMGISRNQVRYALKH